MNFIKNGRVYDVMPRAFFSDSWGEPEDGRGLSCSCRPTGLHGTMRLSVIISLDLYQ